MLTLVTGEPGNGKTACAVAMVLEELERQPRSLFVWGVKELKLEFTPCPPLAQWTRYEPVPEDPSINRAVFDFPSGSLILVDECQDVFRVRAASAKVPDHVAALETHRHQGLDFYLITQKPMQIDSNVRALVGRHIHIKSNWAGRRLYEWSEVRNPSSRTDCSEATTRKFTLPKHVFDLYKSATMHMKPSRRIPTMLWVVVVSAISLLFITWYLYGRLQLRTGGEATASIEKVKHEGAGGRGPTKEGPASPPPPSAKPVSTYRLESYVYAAVGPRIIKRSWVVVDDHGHRETIGGHACRGEGFDAICLYHGQEISYQRREPISVANGQPLVARAEVKR